MKVNLLPFGIGLLIGNLVSYYLLHNISNDVFIHDNIIFILFIICGLFGILMEYVRINK